MILLTTVNDTLELVTSGTSAVDYFVSWVDITTTAFTPGSTQGAITTATTTSIVAAPAASTQRQIKMITIANKGIANQTIAIQKDVSATNYEILPNVILGADESLHYVEKDGFSIRDINGRIKVIDPFQSGIDCRAIEYFKVAYAAVELIGIPTTSVLQSGFPGAYTIGTPGVAGRTTDGTTTTDAGCVPIWTPTGSLYLTGVDFANVAFGTLQVLDLLWINSGIVVTTTTGQTINSVTLPARDANGTTNGVGVNASLLVTASTTNGSAITNMTLTYTNSNGTGSRTATVTSFPATCLAGSVVPFVLQGGDEGIRSVQTITLGTSLVGGAVSLVLTRNVVQSYLNGSYVASISHNFDLMPYGVRLYNGSCLMPTHLHVGATPGNFFSTFTICDR